jgi:hypothetical protein
MSEADVDQIEGRRTHGAAHAFVIADIVVQRATS